MSTLLDLKAYFENYAALHVVLKHVPGDDPTTATFFCMNTNQNTEQFIRNNSLDTIMILLVPDKTLVKNEDNYTWDKHVAYLLLERVPDKTNDAIVAAQNNCEMIANDFMTRLIADRHTLIDSMIPNTVSMEPVGPMGDVHYGYITMFKLVDWFDQQVDPTRWTS